MRYDEPEENEWIWPKRIGWRHACCKCGAVHDVDFRLVRVGRGRRIHIRFRTNRRATATMRRHMQKASVRKEH